jgi:hypothetical protein
MKPVPQQDLKTIVQPIFETRVGEANMEGRVVMEHLMKSLEGGYEARSMAAFVDDLTDPKGCLVLAVGNNVMTPAAVCVVRLIWVAPDLRRKPASARIVKDMMATLDAFARINECETIIASSWLYLGAEPIDELWCRQGFDLQEKVYVKVLADE